MAFFIDFLKKAADLLKEAFTFKKYKAMPAPLAVFLGLIMLPFVAASFAVAAMIFVIGTVFKMLFSPLDALHGVLHKEGQEVKHATQFIIYFFSWSFIFLLYVLLALMRLFLCILYAICALLVYLWSFGGIRFHLFAEEDTDLSVEVNTSYHTALPLVLLLVVVLLLVILPLVSTIAELIPLHISQITLELTIDVLKAEFMANVRPYLIFTVVYSAIALCPYPKKKEQSLPQ